jgi:hypothetical protein
LSLWKDFESRFAGIIDSLKKQRDFVDREAASIDILEAKDSRRRLQEDIQQRQRHSAELLDQNEKVARITQFQHAVTWLAVDDKAQQTDYERIQNRRHDETCKWIMTQPQIVAWLRDDSKYPVLWLNGKPGAGKCAFEPFALRDGEPF